MQIKSIPTASRAESLLSMALIPLFLGFTTIDLFFPAYAFYSGVLKYASVLACAGYAVWQRARLLVAAMAFTLVADYFLLFTDLFAIGIGVFVGAQLCHAVRFQPQRRISTLVLAAAFACALVLYTSFMPVPPNSAPVVVSALYALCLLMAAFRSAQAYKQNPDDVFSRRGFAGMLLFIGCDVCVALHNADLLISSAAHWPQIARHGIAVAIWWFYLPSQFFLCRSAASASLRRRS